MVNGQTSSEYAAHLRALESVIDAYRRSMYTRSTWDGAGLSDSELWAATRAMDAAGVTLPFIPEMERRAHIDLGYAIRFEVEGYQTGGVIERRMVAAVEELRRLESQAAAREPGSTSQALHATPSGPSRPSNAAVEAPGADRAGATGQQPHTGRLDTWVKIATIAVGLVAVGGAAVGIATHFGWL